MADPELEEPDELEPDELEPDELEPDEPEPDEPELEGSAVLPRGTACAQAEEGTATVKVESKQSANRGNRLASGYCNSTATGPTAQRTEFPGARWLVSSGDCPPVRTARPG